MSEPSKPIIKPVTLNIPQVKESEDGKPSLSPPTITSASVPTPQPAPPPLSQRQRARMSPVAQALYDDTIEAKSLGAIHDHKVVTKNPNLAFRWVNRASGQAAPNLRMEQMEVAGFVYATPADCTVVGLSPRENRFIDGDLILMKMDRRQYLGALKANALSAMSRTDRMGIAKRGRTELRKVVNEVGAGRMPDLTRKVATFVPDIEATEGLAGSDE